jgi:GAF domain-containing protein
VGLVEEKEVAKKALRQGKPLLLAGPESFSDFFKYEERENKITSLMSIPLFARGKAMGVLSALLINGRYDFDEKSLRFFQLFQSWSAVIIMHFYEEAQAKDFRITYEHILTF